MKIEEFQKLIEDIYFAKDSARGMEGTFMWFAEEVGELSRALRSNDRENLEEEFADVFAWMATLASIAKIDLSQAIAKYKNGCPRCERDPVSMRGKTTGIVEGRASMIAPHDLDSRSAGPSHEASDGPAFAAVAVKVPVIKVFDYGIPLTLRGTLQAGSRVRVPFGSRVLSGTVTDLLEEPRHRPVKDILSVLDQRPILPPSLMKLARWMADYYVCSEGDVIEGLVPKAVRGSRKSSYVFYASLKMSPSQGLKLSDELLEKAPKRSRVLRALAESGGGLLLNDVMSQAKVSRSPVDTLVKHGHVELEKRNVLEDPLEIVIKDPKPPPTLSDHQQRALELIEKSRAQGVFQGFLLFGVTGSGKTEVYLRAIERSIEAGHQAIVLVPEISLTPQTLKRFKARFERLAVLHSRLTDAQRAEQWHRIRNGLADVVVGARSALFAPVPRLGLIIVDEEHEPSYKQQQVPRYHARDVALMRGHMESAPVILGSATPSLESWQLVQGGRLEKLSLPHRVGGGQLPQTITVDLEQTLGEKWSHVLSDRLQVSLHQTLAKNEQAILFMNRRGFSPIMYCGVCREPYGCESCSVSLTWHRRSKRLRCHYCGHEELPPTFCPRCEKGKLRHLGFGTERVEQEVRRKIPDARVARMDSDTMMARGSHEEILGRFERGDIDVLVGTQMIAKGLDFPRVTLVGVLMADSALALPDFRAAERTFQLVSQVAGRAGRSDLPGTVVVQSFNPKHLAIQAALGHDYERFAREELVERNSVNYPPFGHLARLVWSSEDRDAVREVSLETRRALDEVVKQTGIGFLGPGPAPLEKISGRFRFHAILKSQKRGPLRAVLSVLKSLPPPKRKVRLSIDVDPVQTL